MAAFSLFHQRFWGISLQGFPDSPQTASQRHQPEVSTDRLRPKSATTRPDKENEQKSQDWGRWSQIAYKTDAKTVKDAPLSFSSMFRKSWPRLRVLPCFPEVTRHADVWRELTRFWNTHVRLLRRSSLHVHWFWLQSSTTARELLWDMFNMHVDQLLMNQSDLWHSILEAWWHCLLLKVIIFD